MSRLQIKTGTEGPRHDPYGFNEIWVTRPDRTVVVYHEGIGTFCDVRMANGMQDCTDDPKKALTLFEQYAGITPKAAHRAEMARYWRKFKYHPCGSHHLKEVDGYPGETLVLCEKCNGVIHASFERGAVE
jgi:hypothetical protein